MKSISFKRVLVLVLTVMICLGAGIIGSAVQADEVHAAPANSFVLMAVDDDGWVIRPEYVTYTEGQTVKEALLASDHEFQGLAEADWIQAIDGHVFNISYFYDGGEWDMSVPAATIDKAIVFTWRNEDVYSSDEAYLDVAVKLAEYPEMEQLKKTFAPVKTAYDNAFRDMPAAKAAKAAQLLSAIVEAESAYDTWMAEVPCNVTFDITQGGSAAAGAAFLLTDTAGNPYEVDPLTGQAQLRSGTYRFIVTKGMDQVEGTFEVAENTASKTVTAELPGDPWFGSIEFGGASGTNWLAFPQEISADGNTYTVFVPDNSNTSLYPYVLPGAAIDNDADKKTHRFYVDYYQTGGTYYGDESNTGYARTWASKSSSAPQIVKNGLTGRDDVRLKVVHKTDEYTQRQFKNINIVRVPTLKALSVKEPSGTLLQLTSASGSGFDPAVSGYEVTTIAGQLRIACDTRAAGNAYGAYSEGYSIEVNGTPQLEDGEVTVSVSDGDVITVKAKADNGQESSYSVTVHKVAGAALTLNKESASVTTHLLNAAGSKILPDSETATTSEFVVAPGEYTWVATIDEDYHTSASVTVSQAGTTATVTTPIKEVLLKGLYAKSGISNTAIAFEEADGKAFDWEDHSYTYAVWDNVTNFYVFYEVDNKIKTKKGKVVRGSYTWQRDKSKTQAELEKSFTSSTSASGNQACGNLVTTGEENNSFIYKVEYTENGIRYFQEYSIKTSRRPIAQGLVLSSKASGVERTASMEQKDTQGGSKGFDGIVSEYTAKVPRGATELKMTLSYSAINLPGNGDFVIRAGEDSVSRALNAGTAVLTVPLDPALDTETVDIVMDSGDPENLTTTYSIEVQKTDPVSVRFNITPEEHNLVVIDNGTKEILKKESDGSYELMEGGSYRYTVTAHGYVGQQVTDYIAAQSETITIDLAEAPENDTLNPDLEADWPLFRFDADNNGAVDHLTPVEAEKTTLYWANKVGEGYSGGATGCPIIVGDYLYTYANKTILKIDRFTGDVVQSAAMDKASAFAINSPTYAEGMIFVAQSGQVQAFNAETLESLWIYRDATGGQPNCPIAYHDGYIYTGFWNSETKPANFVCLSVTDEDPAQTDEIKVPTWTIEDNGFYWAGAYVGPGNYSDDHTYILVGTDDGEAGYTTGSGNILSIDRKTGIVIDKFEGVCKGDIRSSISHENGKFYFTSKGGYFCSIEINEDGTFKRGSLKKLWLAPEDTEIGWSESTPPMSTSTPCIYNGRAYVGVSGTGQFSAYSGHNITVIDLETFKIAYTVGTAGYPQTSGLLTNAYDEGDGTVYVYFIDNQTPGALRIIQDRPGQTEPANLSQETVTVSGQEVTYDVGYVLWTPFGQQAQYAICSPISDENGNIYFKNDSAYMMMIGATIDRLVVTSAPDETTYRVNETFDPTGMKVTAYFSNGTSRDVTKYITFRGADEPFLDEEIGSVPIELEYHLGANMLMYQDRDGQRGQEYIPPTCFVNVTVIGESAHKHEYGDPQYSWANDNSTCTATKTCIATDCDNSNNKTVTETVDSVIEVIKPAKCNEEGQEQYTADFIDNKFETQVKYVTTDMLPHDPAEAVRENEIAATCETAGSYDLVVYCSYCDTELDREIVTVDALGHDWDDTDYTWSDDNSKVTAQRVCKRDPAHSETETADVTAEITKPATCEEKGKTKYTADFENVDFETQTKELVDIEAIGHRWGDWLVVTPATCSSEGQEKRVCLNDPNHFETNVLDIDPEAHGWGDWVEIKPATEIEEGLKRRVCSHNDSHVQELPIPVLGHTHVLKHFAAVDPTCETPGNIEYWQCTEGDNPCGYYFSDEEGKQGINEEDKVIGALGHDWNEPVYTWADDNGSVVAKRVCSRDESHSETETAETTSRVSQAATCEEEGKTEYTAEFRNPAFVKQQKEVENLDPIGHDWNEPVYTWADDNRSVTAKRVCKHDGEHIETEKVDTVSEVISAATCEDKGETKYTTKKFDNSVFNEQTKTVADINATGHDWNEPEYTWSKDNDKVTAVRVCRNDTTEHCVEEETVSAAHRVTKAATCDEKGETTYTSDTFGNDAFEQQVKTLKDIEELGHDWGPWKAVPDKEPTIGTPGQERRICSRDADHVETRNTSKVDAKDLADAIADAKNAKSGVRTSNDGKDVPKTEKWTTQEELDALNDEIEYAEGVLNDPASNSEAVSDALKAVQVAKSRYDSAIKAGSKADEGSGTQDEEARKKQKGSDGTAFGPGASQEAAEAAIEAMTSDNDPAGTTFAPLYAKGTKATNSSIKITWKKVSGAKKYILYGNKCGKKNKLKKMTELAGSKKAFNVKKVAGKKLKKKTSYKFMVIAVDGSSNVISTSKVVHVMTKGGKNGNYTKVNVTAPKTAKKGKLSLKKGKTAKLKAKAVGKKVKIHRKVMYESLDETIAKVGAKNGKVKALKKGKTKIIVYAQNGVYKVIKVTVK